MKKQFRLLLLFFVFLSFHSITAQYTDDTDSRSDESDYDGDYLVGLWNSRGDQYSLSSIRTSVYAEGPYLIANHTQQFTPDSSNDRAETVYIFSRDSETLLTNFEAEVQGQQITTRIVVRNETQGGQGNQQDDSDDNNTDGDNDDNDSNDDNNDQTDGDDDIRNIVNNFRRTRVYSNIVVIYLGEIPAGAEVTIRYTIAQPVASVASQYWGFSLLSTLGARRLGYNYGWNETDRNYSRTVFNKSTATNWNYDITLASRNNFSEVYSPNQNAIPNYSQNNNIFYAIWEGSVDDRNDYYVLYRTENITDLTYVLSQHPDFNADWVIIPYLLPILGDADAEGIKNSLSNGSSIFDINRQYSQNDRQAVRGEYIFIFDCTDDGDSSLLQEIRQSFRAFLDRLPQDSYFNILRIGESLIYYNPESVKLDNNSASAASNWVSDNLDESDGDAERFDAIQSVAQLELREGYPRTVYAFLGDETDDDEEDHNRIIGAVYNNRDRMRVCAIGIDDDVSRYLISNIGRAGGCMSEFIEESDYETDDNTDNDNNNNNDNTDTNDDTEDEDVNVNLVNELEPLFLYTTSHNLRNVQSSIECFDENGNSIYQDSENDGFIVKGEPYEAYFALRNLSNLNNCELRASYINSFTNSSVNKIVRFNDFTSYQSRSAWHQIVYSKRAEALNYRAIAADNQDEARSFRQQISDDTARYQILSSSTVLVASSDSSASGQQTGQNNNNNNNNGDDDGDDNNDGDENEPDENEPDENEPDENN